MSLEILENTIKQVIDSLTLMSDRGVTFVISCHPEKISKSDFDMLIETLRKNFDEQNNKQKIMANDLVENLQYIRSVCTKHKDASELLERYVEAMLSLQSYSAAANKRPPNFLINEEG